MIDIVIPVHNQWFYTRQVIKNIRETTHIPYRIILVDNASTDDTIDIEEAPDLKIIRNKENLGFAISVNIGLKAATAEYIGILNNDILMPQNCLETLIPHLKDNCLLIGPLQAHGIAEAKNVQSIYNVRKKYTEEMAGLEKIDKPWPLNTINKIIFKYKRGQSIKLVKTIAMFCAIFKNTTLQKIGYLEEAFVNGGEDEEWCRRITNFKGEFRIALDTCIRHYGRKTQDPEDIRFHSIYNKWNRELLFRMHPGFYKNQGYTPDPTFRKPKWPPDDRISEAKHSSLLTIKEPGSSIARTYADKDKDTKDILYVTMDCRIWHETWNKLVVTGKTLGCKINNAIYDLE